MNSITSKVLISLLKSNFYSVFICFTSSMISSVSFRGVQTHRGQCGGRAGRPPIGRQMQSKTSAFERGCQTPGLAGLCPTGFRCVLDPSTCRIPALEAWSCTPVMSKMSTSFMFINYFFICGSLFVPYIIHSPLKGYKQSSYTMNGFFLC